MNPFSPPNQVSENRTTLANETSSHLVHFLAFWLGSTIGFLATSWVLSRDYVFAEWPTNLLLALFRTVLISFAPIVVWHAISWWRGVGVSTPRYFGIGFALILATDLMSSVMFDILTTAFPTYHFRYPAICLFALVPLALMANAILGEKSEAKGDG